MMKINENLSKSVVLFSGYGVESYPGEYPDRVSDAFGELDYGLLGQVQAVFTELDQLKPDWANCSLQEAGRWAKSQMQLMHPDLSENALDALEWTFTWWWK